jgi:glycerol-3-phosphate cytidylyltransferase
MGYTLERDFGALGVEVIYFPYTLSTSSSALRKTLANIDALAASVPISTNLIDAAQAA